MKVTEAELLANKIASLADAVLITSQTVAKTNEKVVELTTAVTVLITQTGHFETMRTEANLRVDKLESALAESEKECVARIDTISEKHDKLKQSVDRAWPLICILYAIISAISVTKLGK